MNKYQKALDTLKKTIFNLAPKHKKKVYELIYETNCLQELVDRATPKKPENRYYTSSYGNNGTKKRVDIKCPHCKSAFINGVRSSIGVFKEKEKEFIKTIDNQKFCRFCSQAIDWSNEE